MKSKWNIKEANKFVIKYKKIGINKELALRIYTTRLLGNDPKLYYDFSKSKDGIVYDLSGNGNHGIMSGGYMNSEPIDKIPNTTLPHRNRPGRYKSLSHPRNDIVGNRFVQS